MPSVTMKSRLTSGLASKPPYFPKIDARTVSPGLA